MPPPATSSDPSLEKASERIRSALPGQSLHEAVSAGVMQQHFAVAAHGEKLAVGREAQRGDHGWLMVDRWLVGNALARRVVAGAGFDPIANQFDVGLRQGRRVERHRRFHLAGHVTDHETFGGGTGRECRSAIAAGAQTVIGGEIEAGGFQRGLVTSDTVLLQDRLDVAIVARLTSGEKWRKGNETTEFPTPAHNSGSPDRAEPKCASSILHLRQDWAGFSVRCRRKMIMSYLRKVEMSY